MTSPFHCSPRLQRGRPSRSGGPYWRHTMSSFLTALALLIAQPADTELSRAEKTLKDADIATDGPGLLAFFKARTPTPADRQRIAKLVPQLGDESFDVRDQASKELIAAGR